MAVFSVELDSHLLLFVAFRARMRRKLWACRISNDTSVPGTEGSLLHGDSMTGVIGGTHTSTFPLGSLPRRLFERTLTALLFAPICHLLTLGVFTIAHRF